MNIHLSGALCSAPPVRNRKIIAFGGWLEFAGDRPLAWRGRARPYRRRLPNASLLLPVPKHPVQKYRSMFVINSADTLIVV
jgi:hypothetical protein